jgi:hypothetical protein
MRLVIVVVSLTLLVSAAAANPLPAWPAVSLTFADDGSYEPEIYPAPYTTQTAYMMVTCGQGDEYTSLLAISFAIGYTPGSIVPTGYTSLISNCVITGDWETGITLTATEPILTDQVFVARIDFLYMTPGYLMVLDHPDYPRWVITGMGDMYQYCLVNDAGIGQPHVSVEYYCWHCEPMNPVEASSWGVIKALYK